MNASACGHSPIARGRVQVADLAEIDEAAAPVARAASSTRSIAAERIVAARRDDAAETAAAGAAPAASPRRAARRSSDSLRASAASKSGGVASSAPRTSLRVRPGDAAQCASMITPPLCATMITGPLMAITSRSIASRRVAQSRSVAAHRRHAAHPRQPGREQRLPVLLDVVAQPRDDQDGRFCHPSPHAALRRKPCCRPLAFGAKPLAASVSSTVS